MIFLSLFLLSIFLQYSTIHYFNKKNIFIDSIDKKHALHLNPTVRAGGIGIFIPFFIYLLYSNNYFLSLLLPSLIIFLIGLFEDFFHDIKVYLRLFLLILGSALFIKLYFPFHFYLFGIEINNYFLIFIMLLSILSYINAMNFIDTLNGFSSGLSILILLSIAFASYQVNDNEMLNISLILILLIIAFFIFNFPKGKIFLGDGGAYFLGFIIISLLFLLLHRNPLKISILYPIAISMPLIMEITWTIYRRLKKKVSIFKPDKLHLNILANKRIFKNNSITSFFILFIYFIYISLTNIDINNKLLLLFLIISFIVFYIKIYKNINESPHHKW